MLVDVHGSFYNDDDLDTLRYIITLLKQKRNYTWVRERLTAEFGAGDLLNSNHETEPEQPEEPTIQAAPYITEAQVIEPEASMPDAMPSADYADHASRRLPAGRGAVLSRRGGRAKAHLPRYHGHAVGMADLYQECA